MKQLIIKFNYPVSAIPSIPMKPAFHLLQQHHFDGSGVLSLHEAGDVENGGEALEMNTVNHTLKPPSTDLPLLD